jgi:hypothetical protein
LLSRLSAKLQDHSSVRIDSNDYDNSFASAFDGHIAQADPETSADDAEIGNRPTSCWPRLSKRFFA